MAKLLLTARRVTALLNGGKPRWQHRSRRMGVQPKLLTRDD